MMCCTINAFHVNLYVAENTFPFVSNNLKSFHDIHIQGLMFFAGTAEFSLLIRRHKR